jgi:hypothetical protein
MHDKLEVENPCSMGWDQMEGNEKVRHCNKCRFNVYNFVEMEQEEIDELLVSGDRVCGRLFVRPDGTYMTKSCAAKRKRNRVLMFLGFAALLPISFFLFTSSDERENSTMVRKMRKVPVIGKVVDFLYPPRYEMAGIICPPAPKKPGNSVQRNQNPQGE